MVDAKKRRCAWCGRLLPLRRHLRICDACRKASFKAFIASIKPRVVNRKTGETWIETLKIRKPSRKARPKDRAVAYDADQRGLMVDNRAC